MKEDVPATFHKKKNTTYPDADDEHMDLVEENVEDLREEEPDDDQLIIENNCDKGRGKP